MSLAVLFDAAMADRIALTLGHFLWQGSLIALVVLLAGSLSYRTAAGRYGWSLAGLVLMALSPAITLAWLTLSPRQEAEVLIQGPASGSVDATTPWRVPPAGPELGNPEQRDDVRAERFNTVWSSDGVPWPSASFDASDRRALPAPGADLPARLVSSPFSVAQPGAFGVCWSQLVLWGWLAGVAVLGVRMIFGMAALRWLRQSCRAAGTSTGDAVVRLSDRMGIKPPRIGVSDRVVQAMVTGIWRPMVVLPAAWVSQVPIDFLDAVLSHELAHLRRRDLWTIYLQRLVETMLFFHPAVWWLSARLQQEREWCCDELAVRATGEPVAYVRALEHVAGWQRELCMPPLTAGMKGGKTMMLLRRVENVLGIPAPRADARPVGMLLASLLVAAGFVWISGYGHPLKAEVGNNDQQETERDEPNDQEASRDARPDGADGEVVEEDVRPPGRSQARPTGPVSPDEKREFERQVREWKERIRDMIAAGQQAEAQVAEKYLRRHVEEMLERAHRDPFAPPDREALQRDKLITQLLHEARRSGRLEEVERLWRELAEINRRQQLAEARETGRAKEVERLERDELAESKRRAQPPADAVRGRLARLQQQMNAAIKNGRPDEVVELGHQIADVLRSSAHDGPPRPDGPAAAARRATPRRPDDAPRSDDPFAPPFSRSRTDRPPAAQDFLEIVRELREEISQLRREVNELRGGRGR